jgi:hypothetical protein
LQRDAALSPKSSRICAPFLVAIPQGEPLRTGPGNAPALCESPDRARTDFLRTLIASGAKYLAMTQVFNEHLPGCAWAGGPFESQRFTKEVSRAEQNARSGMWIAV